MSTTENTASVSPDTGNPSPRFATPTRLPTKLSDKNLMRHLYQTIGFTEDEIQHLLASGLDSPSRLMKAQALNTIDTFIDTGKLSPGAQIDLPALAQYIAWYKQDHGKFDNLHIFFSKESFDLFDPNSVLMSSTQNLPASVPATTNHSDLKVRINDFPTFSGKTGDWIRFYEKFTSIAELQGFDHLLKENPKHSSRFSTDPNYAHQCHQLYSILKNCCAGGLALPKVNEYKASKDGYLSWQRLCRHYYAKGNVQSYVMSCYEQLQKLALTPNSHGGIDTYISKFEDLTLKIEEAGSKIDSAWKTSMFLSGIKDRNYLTFKFTCQTNGYDYDRCVVELRRFTDELNSSSQIPRQSNSKVRKMRKKSEKPNSSSNSRHLSKDQWNSLSAEQKEVYKAGMKSLTKPTTSTPTRQSNTATSQQESQPKISDPKPSESSMGNIWLRTEDGPTSPQKRILRAMKRLERRGRRYQKTIPPNKIVAVNQKQHATYDQQIVATKKVLLEELNRKFSSPEMLSEPIPRKPSPILSQRRIIRECVKRRLNVPEDSHDERRKDEKPPKLPKIDLLKQENRPKPRYVVVGHFVLYSPATGTKTYMFRTIDRHNYVQHEYTVEELSRVAKDALVDYIRQNPRLCTEYNREIRSWVQEQGIPFEDDELEDPQDQDQEEDSKPPAKNMAKITAMQYSSHLLSNDTLLIDGGCDTSTTLSEM